MNGKLFRTLFIHGSPLLCLLNCLHKPHYPHCLLSLAIFRNLLDIYITTTRVGGNSKIMGKEWDKANGSTDTTSADTIVLLISAVYTIVIILV